MGFVKLLLFVLAAAQLVWGFMISMLGRYQLFPFFERRCQRGRCSDALVVGFGRMMMLCGAAGICLAPLAFMFGKWFIRGAFFLWLAATVCLAVYNEIVNRKR